MLGGLNHQCGGGERLDLLFGGGETRGVAWRCCCGWAPCTTRSSSRRRGRWRPTAPRAEAWRLEARAKWIDGCDLRCALPEKKSISSSRKFPCFHSLPHLPLFGIPKSYVLFGFMLICRGVAPRTVVSSCLRVYLLRPPCFHEHAPLWLRCPLWGGKLRTVQAEHRRLRCAAGWQLVIGKGQSSSWLGQWCWKGMSTAGTGAAQRPPCV